MIFCVLHEAGYIWQEDRTWCDAGKAIRVRKSHGFSKFTVIYPHSAVWDKILMNIKDREQINGFVHVIHVLLDQ